MTEPDTQLTGAESLRWYSLKKELADSARSFGIRASGGKVLRAWITEQIGASFHFDGDMRAFFAAADGTQTLADAVDQWHRTRIGPRNPMVAQFVYNPLTPSWHDANHDGTRCQFLAAGVNTEACQSMPGQGVKL